MKILILVVLLVPLAHASEKCEGLINEELARLDLGTYYRPKGSEEGPYTRFTYRNIVSDLEKDLVAKRTEIRDATPPPNAELNVEYRSIENRRDIEASIFDDIDREGLAFDQRRRFFASGSENSLEVFQLLGNTVAYVVHRERSKEIVFLEGNCKIRRVLIGHYGMGPATSSIEHFSADICRILPGLLAATPPGSIATSEPKVLPTDRRTPIYKQIESMGGSVFGGAAIEAVGSRCQQLASHLAPPKRESTTVVPGKRGAH